MNLFSYNNEDELSIVIFAEREIEVAVGIDGTHIIE